MVKEVLPETPENIFSKLRENFSSLDKFTKLLIIGTLLIVLVTPIAISVDTILTQHAASVSPTPTPTVNIVKVQSIAALKAALADNTVDQIVVANGTYHVSVASDQASDSLWIGSQFASRTRPVTVVAQTAGGVTFDGGGATYFGCISFEQGAHDQTWDGFNCASGEATETGIVTFGGYAGYTAPYNITMKNITILPSCTGTALIPPYPAVDHAFYISQAVGGPHDLLFDNITVNGSGGLASAFHFYHSDATNQNGWNITVQNLHVNGTEQAIMLWDPTLRNITFNTATIVNPSDYAVRYETTGVSNIVFENMVSDKGFYSSQGSNPTGVSFINDSFNCASCLNTASPKPTATPALKPTSTPTPKPTATPTLKPTSTPTPKPTATPTPKPSSPTPTSTPRPTPTATPTPKPTLTPTPPRPTATPTPKLTVTSTSTPSVLNQGNGLLGMYYANRNLSGLPSYRIDSSINFNWRWGSPMTRIPNDNFSVRWTGYVVPQYSETYTFSATADDGVRVWVNGAEIINAWNDRWATTYRGTISLLANQKYSIKVEYYEHRGSASINLKWSSPSTPKAIIPQSQLYN